MKIIKSSKHISRERDEYNKAHEGCFKCPECGNTKFYESACLNKPKDAVVASRMLTLDRRINTHDTMPGDSSSYRTTLGYIDRYICRKCGCAWESEPFPMIKFPLFPKKSH